MSIKDYKEVEIIFTPPKEEKKFVLLPRCEVDCVYPIDETNRQSIIDLWHNSKILVDVDFDRESFRLQDFE